MKGFTLFLSSLLLIGALSYTVYFLVSEPVTCTGPNCSQNYGTPPALTVRHYYDDSLHYYRGTIIAPTPCYALYATLRDDDQPDSYIFDLKTVETTSICTQVVTDLSYWFSFYGPADVSVSAAINGVKALLHEVDVATPSELVATEVE